MKFGPFSESDSSQIEGILTAKQIPFTRSHSEEHVEAWREQDRARIPSHYPSFQGLVENVMFEISELELQRLGGDLERFGIVVSDDGESELDAPEEYLCVRCDFTSSSPRLCPRHRIPLVTFSEKAKWSVDRSERKGNLISRILLLLLVGLAIASVCHAARFDALSLSSGAGFIDGGDTFGGFDFVAGDFTGFFGPVFADDLKCVTGLF